MDMVKSLYLKVIFNFLMTARDEMQRTQNQVNNLQQSMNHMHEQLNSMQRQFIELQSALSQVVDSSQQE